MRQATYKRRGIDLAPSLSSAPSERASGHTGLVPDVQDVADGGMCEEGQPANQEEGGGKIQFNFYK